MRFKSSNIFAYTLIDGLNSIVGDEVWQLNFRHMMQKSICGHQYNENEK
jgi:hypothetical protein